MYINSMKRPTWPLSWSSSSVVESGRSIVATFPFAPFFALFNPLSNERHGRGVRNGPAQPGAPAGQEVANVHHRQGGRVGIQLCHQPAQHVLQPVAFFREGLCVHGEKMFLML